MEFKAIWEGPVEGYVKNFLKKNYWRVAKTSDYDDVLQEAYLVFLEIQSKPSRIDNMKWFMAFFKTAWHNRFYDLAVASSKKMSHEVVGSSKRAKVQPTVNYGPLFCLLNEAPDELKELFTVLFEAPREFLDEIERLIKTKKTCHLNKFFCGLVNRDPSSVNLAQSLKAYLS